ncbi:alpha/beta fold hydrolase, partial [Mycobacterium sp. NAZ190054]|uniref:alpha/beta fold hydrolase n=1 Tax=Mycobacterium sp. NAZ190054 TaxID=1747766 RepID=UPI001E619B69
MRRLLPAVVLSMAVVLPLAACSPGLAANPRFATDSGAGPQGEPQTSDQPPGPPAVEAPKNDLSWRDCTSRVFASAAVQALPGVKLDCASFDADLDPINGASGTVSIGVVRATSVQTPADAGPLVMTTGSDLPSSVQLPVWLSRAGADVLKSHPIVSVDRRGIGMSGALDCRDLFDRQEMFEQAQFQPGDDPVANLGAITMTATTSCTDTIAPGDSAYDNAHAAEDIERLRTTWDVPALALLGIGNGAQVALAYAGSHPNKVARLLLDSPLPLGISAEAATEQRVKGEQAALDAWAAQSVGIVSGLRRRRPNSYDLARGFGELDTTDVVDPGKRQGPQRGGPSPRP